MATAWRQTGGEASDSEDDVIFMGPVTEREIEISRLLNETICLADADASDDANSTLAGLEGGLRACTLEGARESCTMNELELPTTGAGGDTRYPVTSSRLDMSAAPLASGESAGSHQWEQELLLSSTRLTEQREQEQSGRRRSQRPSSGRRESERREESRVWQEMPSENPLPVPPGVGEESQQWEEMPSELQPPPDNGEESQRWEEMPSECQAPAALNESMCEDLSSESLPTPSAAGEESQRWEEMPSECQPPPSAAGEESQRWEELPSECQPPPSVLNESMCEDSSEELPSQGELATAAAAVAEESQKWVELPSECHPPPSAAEESRRWEELPSECQLPPDDGEDSQRWEDMPSKSHYPPSILEESICEDLSEEPLPAVDGSRWLTLGTEPGERPSPGARRGKPRRSATQTGALLDALCEELDASRRCSSGAAARSPPMRSASAGGSGLLLAMHRQMTSPSAVSVAASVESYHTCVGGAADDSRRLTAASALSEISMNPAAPPNTTLGTEQDETGSEDDSRLYESSVEELPDQREKRLSASAAAERSVIRESASAAERSVSRVSRVSEVSDGSRLDDSFADDADDSARDADDSAGGYSDSRPASGRDRITSLASESSLGGSRMSGTSTGGSELNDTLEMMEKLLAMEAEERRLESILQSRTAAGATALGEESELGAGVAGEVVVPKTKTTPAVAVSSATPLRPGASTVQRTTPAVPTPRGRGRPAVPTPRQRAAARSPARVATPRARTGRSPARSPARSAAATPARSATATPARSANATPARSTTATATPARSTTAGATPARSTTFTATPARSATTAAAPASRLKTPTPVTRPTAAMVAAAMLTPRSKPNLKDIVSPVARYIHDGPEPSLVQNVRPKTRMINSVVPQARPPLAPLAEVSPPVPLSKTENSQEAENEAAAKTSQETAQDTEAKHVLRDLNASNVSNASTASAGSSASVGSRIPVKVSRSAVGRENQPPPSSLPTVSYKTSGNMVMDKSEWTKLVRKNTAENRKIGRFLASPAPVLTVKHTGHKSVAARRVRWNDEFSVPDMAVRVRPMRRSVSDCDMSRSTEASLMEVSVCEVRTARPTGAVRH